jgi:hypothetical protein
VKALKTLHAVLVYLGFIGSGRVAESASSELGRSGNGFGWLWWVTLAAAASVAFAFGSSVGVRSSVAHVQISPSSQRDAITAVLNDPFLEVNGVSFLDGSVSTYYSRSSGNLLVVVERVAAPPPGYGVQTVVTCSGHDKPLGKLAQRFFGNKSVITVRNSFVIEWNENCASLRMQQVSPDGTVARSVVLPICQPSSRQSAANAPRSLRVLAGVGAS